MEKIVVSCLYYRNNSVGGCPDRHNSFGTGGRVLGERKERYEECVIDKGEYKENECEIETVKNVIKRRHASVYSYF